MDQILLRGGPEAGLSAATLEVREFWRTTDTGRAGVGPEASAHFFDGTTMLADIALSAAGTTTLGVLPRHNRTIGKITAAAGAGSYTREVVLPETATGIDASTVGIIDGSTLWLRVEMAASANPTVRFRTGSDSGTILKTLAGDASFARNYELQFRYYGGVWELVDDSQITDRDPLSIDRTNSRVNQSFKIPTGMTLTVESGGSLVAASGSTVTLAGFTATAFTLGSGGTTINKMTAGAGTFSSGVVTVSDATITANSIILATRTGFGGTMGQEIRGTPNAGVGFTIVSLNAAGGTETADSGSVRWVRFEP